MNSSSESRKSSWGVSPERNKNEEKSIVFWEGTKHFVEANVGTKNAGNARLVSRGAGESLVVRCTAVFTAPE